MFGECEPMADDRWPREIIAQDLCSVFSAPAKWNLGMFDARRIVQIITHEWSQRFGAYSANKPPCVLQ